MNLITILNPPYDSLFAPGNPSLLPSTLVDDSTSLRYSSLVPSCRCCLCVTWHSTVTFVTVIVTVHNWPLLDSHLLQIAIRKSEPNLALDKPVNKNITNLNTRTQIFLYVLLVNKKSSTRRLSYLQVAVVIFKSTDRQAKSLKQMKCSARCLLPEVAMGERWPTCDACRLRLDYFRLFPKNQLDPMHMNPGKKVWLWNTSWRQAKNKLRVTAWKVQTFSDELN